MPRIDAPTVAEHHRQRRRALLEAAGELLVSGGPEAVTLGAVGARTGLARSSVYQYFGSAADLIAALVEDAFPEATASLVAACAGCADPADRLDAYSRAYLAAATDERHRALGALSQAGLPPACRERVAQLHHQQVAPLREALDGLGVPDPDQAARLVLGVLRAAAAEVMAGVAVEPTAQRAVAMVHGGVDRLIGPVDR